MEITATTTATQATILKRRAKKYIAIYATLKKEHHQRAKNRPGLEDDNDCINESECERRCWIEIEYQKVRRKN